MNKQFMFSVIFALSAFSVNAGEVLNLKDKARAYLDAKAAAQQADSDTADVERLLALMTDDVRSQHLKHEISACEDRGGKERFRTGLLHHLDSYISTNIKIKEMITGLNVVAVKFDETVKYKHNGEIIEETDHKMFVFEFKNGLVSVVRRYY